ncbi:MAG: autotransporter domain-containing protein [Rhizobiaceae bacterium]|nr:autotransporter domain-containing protein [Rhizobiaceae bacterium]
MSGKSVSRVFGGVIENWTMHRWFSVLLGLLFFSVSTFGVVDNSLAITAGVTCPAVPDTHIDDGAYSGVVLRTSLTCVIIGTFGHGFNATTSSSPIAVDLNTNNDGTPTVFDGLRIHYHAATISNVFVDGAPIASTVDFTATTANAFSHIMQYDYAGNTYNFVFSKDAGTDTIKSFTIVAAVTPVITGGATAAVNAAENQTAVTDVQSTDGGGDTEGAGLTYAKTGGADQAKFNIDANTGVLTFVTAPDFETPTDVGGNNVYDVQVTVTNSSGLVDVQDIAVTVTNVPDVAPIITSDGGNTTANITVMENVTAVTTVTTTQGDGGAVTYSISGGADQAKFNIDTNSGALSFAAAPDFETPADVGGNNVYDVQVTATDGSAQTDVQDIAVRVTNTDEIKSNVAITGVPTITNSTTPFTATFTFNEGINGFDLADINAALTNATASAFKTVTAKRVFTALITPNGGGDVVIGVKAGAGKDDAGNDNLAANSQTAILDNVSPTVEITAPTSTDGLTAFNITVQFSEDVTGFVQADITVGNGAASGFVAADANTYTATITPSGKGDVTIDVAANVAVDAVSNGNAAAEQVIVKNTIIEDTQKVIATFMHNRAYHILSNQPNIGGLLNGSNLGGGGPLGDLDVDGNEGNLRLSFSSSLSRLKQKSKADKRIDNAFPNALSVDSTSSTYGEAHNFDIWTEVHGSSARAGNADSDLWVGYFGAHYFVSPDMIIGALVQVDWASETNRTANSSVDGMGWMIGPYIAGRISGTKLSYEARVAWGRSENDVNPNGNYTDQFETERFLASAKLSGSYKLGAWTIAPQAGISWFEENQETYTDTLGNIIPQQTVSLGEYSFGPSFSYDIKLEDGTLMQPSFGISGVQNFGIKKGILTQGTVLGSDDLRAKLDAGIAVTNLLGWSLAFSGFYDGIGLASYDAYGGSVKLTIPLN